ncbi:hypothetical protein [uncultured Sunxiuqinia sp.]|uniref:hypothetical protein n=1 Tax=uncultured Sunxiuqinia sp. TaxID=1573825 RepID=UPI002622A957|nr:hypothetical protein [uncultured Sunxiuqinia sp.]
MAGIGTNINKLKFGFWPGLLLPLIMFLVMYLARYNEVHFAEYVQNLWRFNMLVKLLTLCVLPNLLLFLLLIKRKYDLAARGVLLATFLYAFFVIVSKAL